MKAPGQLVPGVQIEERGRKIDEENQRGVTYPAKQAFPYGFGAKNGE